MVDRSSKRSYNKHIATKKANDMTVTVRDLIWALKELPPDATVILQGSSETFDGYSHPFIELDSDGEVVIREADEPEYDGQPSEYDEWMSFDPDC